MNLTKNKKSIITGSIIIFTLISSQAFACFPEIDRATKKIKNHVTNSGEIVSLFNRALAESLQSRGISEVKFVVTDSPSYFLLISNQKSVTTEDGSVIPGIESSSGYIEKQTPLMFAVALAHEFGHLLGHGPKTQQITSGTISFLSASEGEADYQVGPLLLKVYEQYPEDFNSLILNEEKIEESCLEEASSRLEKDESDISVSILSAAYLNLLLSVTYGDYGSLDPSLTKKDPFISPETLIDYPSNQSRLDSIAAGLMQLPRPRSWAHPSDFE